MLQIGSILDEKYKILNVIGRGGMSVVYLAMNEKANRQWAVKELRKEGIEDFEVVKQSLIIETELLKQLKHPYLPAIADVIETDGTILIVMDYIEGKPLSSILEEEGAQEQDKVIKWAMQLCDVFSYLHSQDPPIIYRDIKPANIMLKPDGNITIIDFGTARRYKEQNFADTTCLGTIGYAAPEQFGGKNFKQTDARTDIYNLGATLYHLLTGRSPAQPPYEIYPIRRWDSSLSAGLEKIILKCTQKNPEDRFATCKELLYALEHFNELDDKHIAEQKKKLAVFLCSILISLIGFSFGIYGIYSIRRQKTLSYNDYLTEASIMIAAEGDNIEIDPAVVALYRSAIEIAPSNSPAYIQLLEYYLDKGNGQTKNGLTLISSMIASGKGNLKENSDLMMKIGEVYFSGNYKDKDFLPDYIRANQYFSLVDKKIYPQVKYYQTLSLYLSELSPDWKAMAEDMHNMEEYIDAGGDISEQIKAYIVLADIYRSNAANLSQTGIEPFQRAIDLFEKSYDILENPYVTEEIEDIYKSEILIGLADSYYRKGNLEEEEEQKKQIFDKSIGYYTQYMEYVSDEAKIVYRNKVADIYRSKEDYVSAEKLYKGIISDYPKDATAYISYATMALIELKDIELCKRLISEAESIDGIASNPNYQSLMRRISGAEAEARDE